jgi:ectoine hydroxylase-related dioxygenase (phytanoyl-CoA dioxygenase family)
MVLTVEMLERPLPAPTDDRERARTDLEVFGYCVVKDVLSPAQVQALRDRVAEQAAGEDAAGVASHDSKTNQRIWILANKGKIFRDLVLHPFATEMMSHLLGDDFLLSSITANIARPGGDPMYLHTDQLYVDFWTPKPVVANILWMLDDFTEENGGTRLMPGSHLRQDWRAELKNPTVAAQGSAGSALVFDGRLIHGTGANRTADKHRHGILTYYCRPFMRQQENFFLGLDPALQTGENEELLRRLGHTIWHGLGRTEKPSQDGVLHRVADPIPALDAAGRPIKAEAGLGTS